VHLYRIENDNNDLMLMIATGIEVVSGENKIKRF
jgi:hypothetical protein